VIYSRRARPLPTYKVKDLGDKKIAGVFYERELQKVVEPDVYKIEKILKWRGKGLKKEALVRFMGYGPEFDQWIKKNELVKL